MTYLFLIASKNANLIHPSTIRSDFRTRHLPGVNFQILHINRETGYVLPYCIDIRNKNGKAHFTVKLDASNWGTDKQWIAVEEITDDPVETETAHEFVGRKIKKSFEGELFKGSVEKATECAYSNGTKLLLGVRYEDGDTEELELDECRALLIEAP